MVQNNEETKKALILVNTGTPDNPTVSAVRRYLFQFLNDKRVIDIPLIFRWILVNLIIVPFRAPKSAKLYQQLWTAQGSPLKFHMENLVVKVQKSLANSHDVYGAMRYGNPSLKKTLRTIEQKNYTEISILPLFPQYATSTTESIADIVKHSFLNKPKAPSVQFIRQFYNNKLFINAFAKHIQAYDIAKYDHVIFSYHGLPLRHIDKMHPGISSHSCPCTEQLPRHGEYCYKATCYHTSRLLAQALNLSPSDYTVSFQSRLSKNWLKPFTDETLTQLATQGAKNVLIAAPSFVADCLETIIELGHEYKNLFIEHGGTELTLVKSLNDSDLWVDAICDIIQSDGI